MFDIENQKEYEPFTVDGVENFKFMVMNNCLFVQSDSSNEWIYVF